MKTLILSLLASAAVASAGYSPRPASIDQSAVAITGGTINGTTTGATTPAAGTFTSLAFSGGAVTSIATITPGSSVAAALATGVGNAGAFVVNGGALGTPSSGVGTNITGVNAATLGGATFAAPGAIGGTTPSTGAFTKITAVSTTSEHLITGNYVNNNYTKANVMAWKHTSSIGSCAARLLDPSDNEMGALGYQNGGGGFYLDGCVFLAGDPLDSGGGVITSRAPVGVTLAQAGWYSGAHRQAKRLLYDADWKLKLYSPTGTGIAQWGENGGLSLGSMSDTASMVDAWGQVIAGTGGANQTSRNNAASGFPFTAVQSQGNTPLLRMVRDNIGKVDLHFQSSPNRIEFTDTDNSSGVPLTLRVDGTKRCLFGGPATLKGYTVATLPAGTTGDMAYVTDALAPSFLVTIVGGGSVTAPVFYNGSNWVAQ